MLRPKRITPVPVAPPDPSAGNPLHVLGRRFVDWTLAIGLAEHTANIRKSELGRFIRWAHGQGMDLTLIEVMPLGEIDADRFDHYLPLTDLRARLEQRLTLTPSAHRTGGPARYADVAETGGRLGFITPLTGNFCEGCNRVRVTATGQLFPCLGGIEQVDLRAALRSDDPESALDAALDLALRIKPERHHFAIERPGSAPTLDRHMSATGG